jgi:formiminoglutamase
MSGASSSADGWYSRLEPVQTPHDSVPRPDDPRLSEVTEFWQGGPVEMQAGRPVLVGFPTDEGVRRNQGRPGAAAAPFAIRRWLYRLTPCDCREGLDLAGLRLLDLGNVRCIGDLEEAQCSLAEVIAGLLQAGAIPLVLGGGHETAYGHFLGYVAAGRPVGIINIDAHLDVRPCPEGWGTSGSSFRQALEHPTAPLPGEHYVCLGAQKQHVSCEHWQYVAARGGTVRWVDGPAYPLLDDFETVYNRMADVKRHVYVSLDADVVAAADVPGVSAPNPLGLPGRDLAACLRLAGRLPAVSSLDLVEINPHFDRDEQSARWAAAAVWNFLIGLAARREQA